VAALPAPVEAALVDALRAALDVPDPGPFTVVRLGGGCISPAARVAGRAGEFFVKWSPAGPADLFEREADGLRALAQARSGLRIPRVVAATDGREGSPALLVTEYLAGRRERPGDGRALGRGLAALHRAVGPRFGFPVASYCGSTLQDNTPEPTWAEFYARRRLVPLLARLERERGLSLAERRVYEIVLERLPDRVAPGARPALIHGDLWSGNVHLCEDGPALVDPACAWAEREMEFGIATLFGGFPAGFWEAYDDAYPLAPGWRERNGLYQLYHLLNHHLLFGGGYGAQALDVARRYA
jgi:fructosamine-3-kinase